MRQTKIGIPTQGLPEKDTLTAAATTSQSIERRSFDPLDEHAELPGQLEPVVFRHPDNVQKQPGDRLQ